jgi:predicted cupin superfamily sugar epimerase
MDPDALIAALGLAPHPEGGWYRETFRSPAAGGARPSATVIHFLLKAGERSHWHRVDADEIWCWQAGSALLLEIAADAQRQAVRLGPGLLAGEVAHAVVPARAWQAARADAGWALLNCIVAPGFRFEGFELAPPGWEPG